MELWLAPSLFSDLLERLVYPATSSAGGSPRTTWARLASRLTMPKGERAFEARWVVALALGGAVAPWLRGCLL